MGDITLHTPCKRKCSFRCGTRVGQDLRVHPDPPGNTHRSKSLSLLLAQSQAIAPPYSDTQAPISGLSRLHRVVDSLFRENDTLLCLQVFD